MTMKSLMSIDGTFGFKAPGSQVDLESILRELQGFRVSLALGGAQSAAQSLVGAGGVTGASSRVLTSDTILAAIQFITIGATGGINNVSFRNDVYISSTGNIKVTGAATTGSHLMVFWWDQSGFVS